MISDDLTLLPWDVEEQNFGIIFCLIEDAWKPSGARISFDDPAVARVSQKYEPPVQQSSMLSQQHFATLPTELPVAISMLDDTELGIEHLEPSIWSTDAFPLAALCQRALNRSEDRMKGVKSQQPADFTRSTAKRSKTELALSPCAISAYA